MKIINSLALIMITMPLLLACSTSKKQLNKLEDIDWNTKKSSLGSTIKHEKELIDKNSDSIRTDVKHSVVQISHQIFKPNKQYHNIISKKQQHNVKQSYAFRDINKISNEPNIGGGGANTGPTPTDMVIVALVFFGSILGVLITIISHII